MARCVRGTCSRNAVAGLRYDPIARTLWLLDLPGADHQVLALCGAHADNLTVPDGWVATDDRNGEPRLWSMDPAAEPSTSGRAGRRPHTTRRLDHERAKRQTVFEELELFESDMRDPQGDPGSDDEATANARRSLIPGAETAEAPKALDVDAGTPLLARAFRASQVG